MLQDKDKQPEQKDKDNPKPQPQGGQAATHNDLTKKDIPDSTNESTGVPGSGQRQDSN